MPQKKRLLETKEIDIGMISSEDTKPQIDEQDRIQYFSSSRVTTFIDGSMSRNWGQLDSNTNATLLESCIIEVLKRSPSNDVTIYTLGDRNVYSLLGVMDVLYSQSKAMYEDKAISIKKITKVFANEPEDIEAGAPPTYNKFIYGLSIVVRIPESIASKLRSAALIKSVLPIEG